MSSETISLTKNDWVKTKIGDIIELKYGKGLPKTKRVDGKYPVYGSNGIVGSHNESLIKAPAIVVGRKGSVGEIHFADKDFWPIDTTFYIEESDKYDLTFIYYLLKSMNFKYLNTDSAVPGLNRNAVYDVDITIPKSIDVQKEIGRILSECDQKITNNNKINKKLERMGELLFKQWFVDFEFPNEDGKPYKSSGGEMQVTNSTNAPKKWRVCKLSEAVTVKRGGSPRPIAEYMTDKSGLPWVKISDATASLSSFILKTKEFIKKSGLKKTVYLKRGSLILSNSATPGIPKFLDLNACIHDGWLYFPEIKEELSYNYLYFLFKHIRPNLIQMGNGTVFTNLKTDILKNYVVSIPDDKILKKFDMMINDAFNKIKINSRENSKLNKLINTLLPKLMSGEVRV